MVRVSKCGGPASGLGLPPKLPLKSGLYAIPSHLGARGGSFNQMGLPPNSGQNAVSSHLGPPHACGISVRVRVLGLVEGEWPKANGQGFVKDYLDYLDYPQGLPAKVVAPVLDEQYIARQLHLARGFVIVAKQDKRLVACHHRGPAQGRARCVACPCSCLCTHVGQCAKGLHRDVHGPMALLAVAHCVCSVCVHALLYVHVQGKGPLSTTPQAASCGGGAHPGSVKP